MADYGRTWNRPLGIVQGKKPLTGGMTAKYSYAVATGDLTVAINDPASRKIQSQLPGQDVTASSVTSLSREKSFSLTFKAQEIVLDGVHLPKQTEENENNGVHFEAYNDDRTMIVRGWLLPRKSEGPEDLYVAAKIETPFAADEPRSMLLAEDAGEDGKANCVDAVVVVIPPP